MVRVFERDNETVILTHMDFTLYVDHEEVRNGELNDMDTAGFMRGLLALGFKEKCMLSA